MFLLYCFTAKAQLPYTANNYCLDQPIPVNTNFINSQTKNLIVKDLNGDTKNDVLVSNGFSAISSINCYSFNLTSKTFSNVLTLNTDFGINTSYIKQAINVGDFGGSNLPEIIFTNDTIISFYKNNGGFNFMYDSQLSIPSQFQYQNHYLEVADFNNDAKDDIMLVSESTANLGIWVVFYRQVSPFTFVLDNTYKIFNSFSSSFGGTLDINIGNIDGGTTFTTKDVMFTISSSDSIYFMKNIVTSAGAPINVSISSIILTPSIGSKITNSELIDLNNDNKLDFAFCQNITSTSNCAFNIFAGSNSFNLSTAPVSFTTPSNVQITDFKFADITGDNKTDFCGVGAVITTTTIPILAIYKGNNSPNYFSNLLAPIVINMPTSTLHPDELKIADMDGNGASDILFKPRGSNSDRTQMIPNFTFTLSTSPVTATVCSNAPANFTATSGAFLQPFNYFWTNSLGSSVGTNSIFTTATNGSYTATLQMPMYSNGSSCKITFDSVKVTSGVKPNVTVSNTSTTVCYGTSVSSSASGASTYTWINAASPTFSAYGSTFNIIAFSTSTYIAIGEAPNGCKDSADFQVYLHPSDMNNIISSSNTVICLGDSASLSLPTAKTYTWSTGSNNSVITISPTTNTIYSLTYLDNNTCVSTKTINIVVDNKCSDTIVVYNSLTPNGDGINDLFYIKNIEKYPNNHVNIFNRWGKDIFTKSNYNNTTVFWPAKEESNAITPSTYFYIINLGNGTIKKGWVEVLNN